jgi:hypothetical protein
MNHTLQAAIYRLYRLLLLPKSSKLLQLFNSCEGSKLLLTNHSIRCWCSYSLALLLTILCEASFLFKGVLLIQHGTNLMRSKLLIAWLITLQAASKSYSGSMNHTLQAAIISTLLVH